MIDITLENRELRFLEKHRCSSESLVTGEQQASDNASILEGREKVWLQVSMISANFSFIHNKPQGLLVHLHNLPIDSLKTLIEEFYENF